MQTWQGYVLYKLDIRERCLTPMHWGLQEASTASTLPSTHTYKHKERHSLCTYCSIFCQWQITWPWVCAFVKCSKSVLFPLWLAIWYWKKCKTWKKAQPSHYREFTLPRLTSWAKLAITLYMAGLVPISYVWWNTFRQWYTAATIFFLHQQKSLTAVPEKSIYISVY